MSDAPAVKMIAFLKRRSDMSLEEFERYYESHHVPLILRTLPKISRYIRNYVNPDSVANSRAGGDSSPPCDVITELWFNTESDYRTFQAVCSNPDNVKKMADDEVNFLEMESIRTYLVKEQGGDVIYDPKMRQAA